MGRSARGLLCLSLFLRLKFVPVRALGDLIETFAQGGTGDAQAVDGAAVWLNSVATAQFDGVDAEIVGDLVHMNLDGVARLRGAVAAFGAAGRLVGKETHTLKFVARQFVGDSLQDAGVVGGGNTIGAIRAAIQEGTEVHGR